ncbi:MAG: DUF493 family protein, partial [Bacteriovoracaceae bacterium]
MKRSWVIFKKFGGIKVDFTKFKALLDEQMQWPEHYNFKFVIKTEQKPELLDLLSEHAIEEKKSKNGTYTSITSKKMVYSSEDVVAVYQEVSKIEG